MHSAHVLLVAFLFATAIPSAALGHIRHSSDRILLQGDLNTSCISTTGGTVYLHMSVITPSLRHDMSLRKQLMNIAIVLDRSGSMGDERKMDYAKKAILSLIDRLSSEDYISIVIYDDEVETLLRTQRIGDRRRIKKLIDGVYPRGATNLGGGLIEGFRQLEHKHKREYTNRVILISDGLANRGIVDPHELNRIARGYRGKSISLTTIGVGLDYNENLMLGLAQHGGGNYYFVESPSQLATIFEQEVSGLSNVLVQNALIELTLGRGVEVSDVIGCEWSNNDRTLIIPLGDLYMGSRRELTVELRIPSGTGKRRVAEGVLRFDDAHRRIRSSGFVVDIRYSSDVAEQDRGRNWDTQARVDVALSTRKVEQATELLGKGNREAAMGAILEAQMMLRASPAHQNSPNAVQLFQEQLKELNSFAGEIESDTIDMNRTKKSIQFRNYKTQRER